MDPKTINLTITDSIQYKLLGCVFYGDPFHSAKEWSYKNEIGKLWSRFYRLIQKYESYFSSISKWPKMSYELHLEPEDYDGKKNKNYYVFVGICIQDFNEIPLEMFIKTLPRTRYLEFTTEATDQDSGAEKVFGEFLGSKKKYQQSYPFIIQRYDKRYKGLNKKGSYLDWLIPIK